MIEKSIIGRDLSVDHEVKIEERWERVGGRVNGGFWLVGQRDVFHRYEVWYLARVAELTDQEARIMGTIVTVPNAASVSRDTCESIARAIAHGIKEGLFK